MSKKKGILDDKQEKLFQKEYTELLQSRKEIGNFFSSSSRKNIETQMSDEFEGLQRVSRCNYIKTFAFDKHFPLPLPEEKIIGTFRDKEIRQFMSFISNPQYFQTISSGIRTIYETAQSFASAVYAYFQLPQHESDFPIFVNVLFPALYGFFLSEEQSTYAFDFLSNMFDQDTEFFKPFFVSFFHSSVVFTDIFWHTFFGFVKVEERFKPSIAQLYEYFVKALRQAVIYFSPYHIQIAITFMLVDPIGFCECFFKRFLLTTFNAWVTYNPSVSSSKVTSEQLEMLFTFFSENTDTQVFQEIMTIFQTNVFSLDELVSFVEHASAKKVTCLISPLESRIISEIFMLIPELAPSIFPASKVVTRDGFGFDIFTAGSFEVHLHIKNTPQNKKGVLIYDSKPTAVVEDTEENKRSWNIIMSKCNERCVDPLKTLMMCDVDEPSDTFYDKNAKKKARKRCTPSLKRYVLSRYKMDVVQMQTQFEEFLQQQHLSNLLANMKSRLTHHGEIIEQLILSKLTKTETLMADKVFTTNIIRLQMRIDEDSPQLQTRDSQQAFDAAIRDYTLKPSKFQEFLEDKKEFFKSPVSTLSRLDELSLGDRFFVLYHVYSQITTLTKPMRNDPDFSDPLECTNALFAKFVADSKCRSFLKTFICICRFQLTQAEQFKNLPEDMISVWNKINAFIISLINSDSFSQAAKFQILHIIK